jgi:hypothetical protein
MTASRKNQKVIAVIWKAWEKGLLLTEFWAACHISLFTIFVNTDPFCHLRSVPQWVFLGTVTPAPYPGRSFLSFSLAFLAV